MIAVIVPDVVLMDTQMKPLSGFETARLIKAKYPNVKIIMMTGSETECDSVKLVDDIVLGVWNKSTDAGMLLRLLAEC